MTQKWATLVSLPWCVYIETTTSNDTKMGHCCHINGPLLCHCPGAFTLKHDLRILKHQVSTHGMNLRNQRELSTLSTVLDQEGEQREKKGKGMKDKDAGQRNRSTDGG